MNTDTFPSMFTGHPIAAKGVFVDTFGEDALDLACEHGHRANGDVWHDGIWMFCIAVDNAMGHTCPTGEWMAVLNRILAM